MVTDLTTSQSDTTILKPYIYLLLKTSCSAKQIRWSNYRYKNKNIKATHHILFFFRWQIAVVTTDKKDEGNGAKVYPVSIVHSPYTKSGNTECEWGTNQEAAGRYKPVKEVAEQQTTNPLSMAARLLIVVSASWNYSQSFERFSPPSWLLQQKTMITIENGIFAGDLPLWLRGNFYDSFGSIANICFYVFSNPSQRTVNRENEMRRALWFSSLLRIHVLAANEKIRIFWCVQSYSTTSTTTF